MIDFLPQNESDFPINYYLEKATELDHSALSQLEIIYVMTIRHLNSTFGSLIIDRSGQFYKSKWSTTRLTEEFFSTFGYNYQSWSQFLKSTFNRPRTIFPYVNKNMVFIRLRNPENKHSDWVNITFINDLHIRTQKDDPVKIQSIQFMFDLANYSKLSISLNNRLSLVMSQISYAFQLVNFWYDFQVEMNEKDLIFEPTQLQTYIGNPAFKIFTKTRVPYKDRLKAKIDLAQFIKYNQIHNYLKSTTQRKHETYRTRLSFAHMHQKLFKPSIRNKIR